MSYIYHMKPVPFEGSSLIPLNQMDKEDDLYKRNVRKYIGREDLMDGVIPKLECKWNDVVHFSSIDPQHIVDHLKAIEDDFKIFRNEYFKIDVNDIIDKYEAVVFDRNKKQTKGDFKIAESEVELLSNSYSELKEVPKETVEYWNRVKEEGGPFLWFAFVPHILVKGKIDTSEFELCSLK